MKFLRILPLLYILLISCEKDDIYEHHYYEQVIIDPGRPDYYLYWDSSNPTKAEEEYFNGFGKYYFEVQGNTVTLHPTQKLRIGQYHRNPMDRYPANLEIINNSVQKSNVTRCGVFRLIY